MLVTFPTGTNTDLAKLMCNPNTTSKEAKISYKYSTWLAEASQKIKVSSAKRRWVTMRGVLDLVPTVKPKMWLARTTPSNKRRKASITITNRSGEKGSPWHNLLELLKKSLREPLIKIENLTMEIQNRIHFLHFSENPQRCNIYIRKSQLTWSKAFSTSNLHKTPRILALSLLSKHLLATKTESRICLSRTKAFWDSEIIPEITLFSLLASNLEMIL